MFSIDASARNNWMETDNDFQTTEVLKPVDPVFNDGNDIIEIVAGDSWFLQYDLRLDRKYHALLVGDFVINDTDPVTDYDVYTYLPNGADFTTHTESAGLPEQVANDGAHQYFVPSRARISMKLHWGYPMRKNCVEFREKTRNWLALVNIYLLIDIIEVGGGTEQSLDTMANFVESTKHLEDEKKSVHILLTIARARSSSRLLGSTYGFWGSSRGRSSRGGSPRASSTLSC